MDAQPSVNELAFASHWSVARFGKVGSDTVTVREGGGGRERRQHGKPRVVTLSAGRVTAVTQGDQNESFHNFSREIILSECGKNNFRALRL